MSEFPSLSGATSHLIALSGPPQNPSCLLQLQETRMAFYKFLGGYIDIATRESLEDTIRREVNEEAPGLQSFLDLSDKRLYAAPSFTVMNYRKERRESCTFTAIWMSDAECASAADYIRNQSSVELLAVTSGETSGLVITPLLNALEETFSTDANRRKLLFPYGFLEHLSAILPLDHQRLAAVFQMMKDREAEKKK